MPLQVRRVITGLDSSGRSCIALDATMPVASPSGVPKVVWKTDSLPARNDGEVGKADFDFDFDIMRRGGSAFAVVEIPSYEGLLPPGMHATNSLDYFVILRGKLEVILETGSAILESGDVCVTRGVLHGSRVIGNESVVMAIVLIPAEPIGKGATI